MTATSRTSGWEARRPSREAGGTWKPRILGTWGLR